MSDDSRTMIDRTFERLTSARLVLRRFRAADIDSFVAYRADPAIARFQSWENFTLDDGRAFHAWISRQHPDTPGSGSSSQSSWRRPGR